MSIDLMSLNARQREAVEWGEGPLLVLAGPGSGKTRVLTYRVARILASTPNDRFKVLSITFTNKAATEMRNRLDGILGEGKDRALQTTFHSFAADILRQHGSHIGLKPDFAIITEQADRESVLTDAINLVVGDEEAPLTASNLLPMLDRMQDECMPQTATELEPMLSKAKIPNAEFLAETFEQYRTKLIAANQLDFGALIALTVMLLESNAAIAKQIRRVYRYVCVDEFQDTNEAQYRLLSLLVPSENPNLFVVADDDQIIYQWNGASPERLTQIRKAFNMRTIQLPENYRCPPEVIELANRLIVYNQDRAADKSALVARKASDPSQRVRVKKFANFSVESDWIAEEISKLPLTERANTAILARSRKLLDQVVIALGKRGVPGYVAARKSEFQSAPYRWLHSMLRLANSRQNREQLRRVCKSYYDLEGVNLRVEDVVARSSVEDGDYLRTWLTLAAERDEASIGSQTCLSSAKRQLAERNDHWGFMESANAWFEKLAKKSRAAVQSSMDDFDEEQKTWKSLRDEVIATYGKEEVTLHGFLQEFDLRSKEPPPPKAAVKCFTIHAAKGMEFRHVYLAGLAEEQMPSWAAVKKGAQSLAIREERRNCFVAITRAEETLTLTYASNYFGHPKSPSRFLKEMGLV